MKHVKIKYFEFVHDIVPIKEEISEENFWKAQKRFVGEKQGQTVAVMAYRGNDLVYRAHFTDCDEKAKETIKKRIGEHEKPPKSFWEYQDPSYGYSATRGYFAPWRTEVS